MIDALPVHDFARSDIKTSYCIDLDTRDRQVAENLARIPGRLTACDDRPGRVAVVCYGPSLEETWEQVRDFDHIITVSGAHKFLLDKGIVPTHHLEVDPRPHKADLIGKPHPDVEYLIASVCHRKVFDLLDGCNVKLWHVFAHEAGRTGVPVCYPRGEWSLTGGANCGMRAIVLARFLGFKKMTVFGMDYSFKNDGTQHAGWHPKEFPNIYAVEVAGQFYYTNPPMHQYAQQFFHEVTQIGDVEMEVVGNGLLQAQIREHLKTGPLIPTIRKKPSMIAAASPPTITSEYISLNRRLHESDPGYGISGSKRAVTVRKLIDKTAPLTILDYGCGKGSLGAALDRPIWEYDPAIPGKDAPPRPADLVICSDVLEHVEPECLDATLLDLARCTLKVCYAVINTGPAIKVLADGRNAHLVQQPAAWWKERLSVYFHVASLSESGPETTVILGPKPKGEKQAPAGAPPLDISQRITPARHDETEVRFHTPNAQTHWRATTLFTKEPATIEWIDSFQPGEVLYDIGANVGGYTVWAAERRGVTVHAFEPESGNYALLCRNIDLNKSNATAWCVAVTDVAGFAALHLSSREPGSGCNTYGESVGPDLKPRASLSQGCVGHSLDILALMNSQPDHIKIDVDGMEHKVIAGAKRLLAAGTVKSLLVEVNPNLEEHQEMLRVLEAHGYTYDEAQRQRAMRTEGPFKGCAEVVFRKKVECPAVPAMALPDFFSTPVSTKPFPWLYAENVFPEAQYQEMLRRLPTMWTEISKSRPVKGYPQRFTAVPDDPYWQMLFAKMRDGTLKRMLCQTFGVPDADTLTDECLLVRDYPGYSIGPHTDSPKKVITALIYLPEDGSMTEAGTSIYAPRDPEFRCKGGPHYEFGDDFKRVRTMPYQPNSAFVFLKTDNSFHGVEPCAGTRTVCLYDIRRP
jgi:FkbM family methyltransferase